MKPPKPSFSDSLLHAEWDELAKLLQTVENGIEGDSPEAKKLRATLGVVKILMCENMRVWNGQGSIDASFFIGSYKTILKIENEFDAKGIENRQFVLFLKLLLQKFEKQRLLVKKPFLMIEEFGKMKEVVEEGKY